MFVRQVKKQNSKDGKVFYQYSLVQSMRIDGKPRQRTIVYLGSDNEMRDKDNRAMVLQALKSLIYQQKELFPLEIPEPLKQLAKKYYEKYQVKYQGVESPIDAPPAKDDTHYEQVAVDYVNCSDCKSFGAEHLCLQTLDKLHLSSILAELGFDKKDISRALISIAAKAIYSASEHKTAQILDINSSLKECLGYKSSLTHKHLYQIADKLYEHKEVLDERLYSRIKDMFSLEDSIIIFDISNTYFESRKDESQIATHGCSKEKRYDCPIVVFTGVINVHGFIRHSRIYEGNKPDKATLSDMIADLEQYSSSGKKTIVMDAGIADEENLSFLNEQGYNYVCVSRKRIKDYPSSCLQKQLTKSTDRGRQQVKLSIFTPKDYTDTWMYVESANKRVKEASMRKKLRDRFEQDLQSIQEALHKKGGTKRIDKVWQRVGRYKERHRNVSGSYEITVKEKNGQAVAMSWKIKTTKIKEDKNKGVYFIRTNIKKVEESLLWDIYNTIRNVESTFRCLKTDLNIRPIYHQNDERIESHLYLTMLAYQLVNTVRHMLSKQNINYDWRNIVRIMSTQQLQTIEMPTKTKTVYVRRPSKPIVEAQQIYKAANCKSTQKTIKKYVVYH